MHHLIQQVKAGIGFVIENGNIAFLAVHGKEYFPALRRPVDGLAVRTEISGAEIVQLFGNFQVDQNGM